MYYKSMYKMFGSMELALAAYNAGPGNVKKNIEQCLRSVKPEDLLQDYDRLPRNFKAHPDPAMIAAKNGTLTVATGNQSISKVVANAPANRLHYPCS